MEPYVAFPQSDKIYIYDLFAVVNHYGGMNGGHYTSIVQSGGSWYEYDDSLVEKITEAKVRSSAAYILFYKRRDVAEVSAQLS